MSNPDCRVIEMRPSYHFHVIFSGFIFPHKMTDFLEGTLSEELIRNYRDDLDFQNLIDLLQKVRAGL